MAPRTKIVATIGPASQSSEVLESLMLAGMDVARIGLAHGTVEEHVDRIARIRAAAAATGRTVGILADLPGPKVRAGAFADGGVFLLEGERLALAPGGEGARSDERRIEIDVPTILSDLHPGDPVILGDGGVRLLVDEVHESAVWVTVESGGRLQGRPGVTLPAGRNGPRAPTAHDLELLQAMVDVDIDMVAVSFVTSASDITAVRDAAGPDGPMLVAKIETAEAVADLDNIIAEADAVMVARGDLGVRLAAEDVPHHQKRIIKRSVAYGRPVITATQMLESMTTSPSPTRAEVSDVANAVFDGTSAVMLSGETAIGHDPVNVVRTMARITERAEVEADWVSWGRDLGRLQTASSAGVPVPVRVTAAISAAAWRAVQDVDASAIICATRSGATARAIARFRPHVPIFAVSPLERTARQLSLSWGVTPLASAEYTSTDEIVWYAVESAVQQGLVKSGDVVAVLAGSPEDPEPVTDSLRLVRVR
ncbi:MAG: Pyruvate kinase [uncultured Acidimicrobiales bacterium]|uniref:Pyruvate kinase n=1 Tax=uncultured Acidimicrobiales bacterium TaxID=310071 RepID=A0A6J4IQY2_9ACTN|nr:MAG: Pyruvate kinase [uncultured Acidimicrobiales bacterium]